MHRLLSSQNGDATAEGKERDLVLLLVVGSKSIGGVLRIREQIEIGSLLEVIWFGRQGAYYGLLNEIKSLDITALVRRYIA